MSTSSQPAKTSRSRSRELRVRSGCWKCRGRPFPASKCARLGEMYKWIDLLTSAMIERRVKCPEQRPVCQPCQRLGLTCRYEIRLSWESVRRTTGRHVPPAETSAYDSPIRDWMFLNTTLADFGSSPETTRPVPLSPSLAPGPAPSPETAWPAPSSFSPLALRTDDARLWDYFIHFITPRCALAHNPYQDVLLRLAVAGGGDAPRGPLLDCVLAVAANQMQILGHGGESAVSALHRRNRALSGLRQQVQQHAASAAVADQILWSAVMMCFLDISLDCPRSWGVHAAFATSFLLQVAASSTEPSESHRFAAAYLSAHYILAGTAADGVATAGPSGSDSGSALDALRTLTDDVLIRTLTGCSKRLLELIADTTALARDLGASAAAREQRRDRIERGLHQLGEEEQQASPDTDTIREAKRLAALLYLYARVDGSDPCRPHMARLTARILALVADISTHTNTVLWPLFVVATLGVRPEREDHRRIVLTKLQELQQTRQLGNVRKARQVIEDVWRARDLRPADATQSWTILGGRVDGISLA